MADIDLLFGVAGGGDVAGESGSLIKSQLESIIKGIEPLKVKVGIDVEASKKDFSADVESLFKGASKTIKLKLDAHDIGKPLSDGAIDKSIKKSALTFEKAEEIAKNYYATLRQVNEANKSGMVLDLQSDGTVKALSKEFEELAERSNQAQREMDALRKAVYSLPDTQKKKIQNMLKVEAGDYRSNMFPTPAATESSIKSVTSELKEQVYTYKEAESAIKKYNEIISTVTKNNADIEWDVIYGKYVSKSGVFNQHAESLNETEAAYNRVVDAMHLMPLEEQVRLQKLLNQERERYNIALEGSVGKERYSFDYNDSVRAVKDYYKTLSSLERNQDAKKHVSLQETFFGSGVYEYRSDSKDYEELASALNRTKTAFDSVYAARANLLGGQQARLQTLMAQESQKYSLLVEDQANKVRLSTEAAQAKQKKLDSQAAIKAEADAYEKATFDLRKYYEARNDALKFQDRIKYNSSTGEWETQEKNLQALVDRLNKVNKAYVDAVKSVQNFSDENKKAFFREEIGERQKYNEAAQSQNRRSTEAADKKAISDEAKSYNEATTAIKEYYKAKSDAIKFGDEIYEVGDQWETQNVNLKSLVERLNETKRAYAQAKIDADSFSSANKDLFNSLDAKEALAFREAIEAYNRSMEGAEVKEYQKQLDKVNDLLVQIRKNLKEWSSSKNGASSDSYRGLEQTANVLEELRGELLNTGRALKDFDNKFDDVSSSAKNFSTNIKLAGENTKSIKKQIGGFMDALGISFTFAEAFQKAIEIGKKMFETVTEVDTAMTELKKVTEEAESTYIRFLDNARDRSHGLGATVAETVNATADFARLGHGIADASSLADAAIVYKNVGDGIEDISVASESIISTMQAFGVEAKDAMSIVDSFNAVGNNFAISSKGVGDALLNSAASLHAAGNDIHESIALIAAANTTIQDPGKVGTALKTMSMYLRASKTEAEEAGLSTEGMANSVSELRSELLALTGQKVDIMSDVDAGEYKSTVEILRELSTVWDDLSSASRTNITELIGGGVRNANIISALMQNFNIVEDALATSQQSAGSALAENEKYLDSVAGKVAQLQSSLESLSTTVLSSDLVKMFVSLLDAVTRLATVIADVAFDNFFTTLSTLAIGGGAFKFFKDLD